MRLAINYFVFTLFCSVRLFAATAAAPWDIPFAGAPAAILQSAASVKPNKGMDAVVLLNEQTIEFDKSGRRTHTVRLVTRLVGSNAAQSAFASVEHQYSPWRHDKPDLRARVITKAGEIHWLDAKTIAEGPARDDGDPLLYADDRMIRAPLPAIADGAVVEYEIRIREHHPFFESGVAERLQYPGILPRRIHVRLEAPAELGLRTKLVEFPDTARIESLNKGTRRVEVDYTPPYIPTEEEFDWSKPVPAFSFSTGRSWAEVAAAYERIVEDAIRGAKLAGFTDTGASATVLETIAKHVAKLHEKIRYTGIEFGESAIVPASPAVILERKFGDCKDKAALLVAMLRESGIKAHVALLDARETIDDVEETLPGLGVFNHAIVYIPGDKPLWIDATAAYTRVGELPPADQGRLALIATSGDGKLIRTPESESSANSEMREIEVTLKPSGAGKIKETVTFTGTFESQFRATFSGFPEEDRRILEQLAKEVYLAKELGEFSTPRRDDFSKPYRIQYTSLDSQRAPTIGDESAAGIFEHFVFQELPWQLTLKKKIGKAGKQDVLLPKAYRMECRYLIRPPASFKAQTLPKSEDLSWGPAKYERKFALRPDGAVEITFRFDTGKRRYTAEEAELVRQGVSAYIEPKPLVISFLSEVAEAVALGDMKASVTKAAKLVQTDPQSVAARARLARLLLQVGAGLAARTESERAIGLNEKAMEAHQSQGWTLQHDSFGRRFTGDWDFAGSIKAYRKALELEPSNPAVMLELAILLEHNERGVRYAPDSQSVEAERIYREVLEKTEDSALRNNLASLLLHTAKYDVLEKELPKLDLILRNNYQILLAALREGAGASALVAQQHYPDPAHRGEAMLSIARTLVEMRQYGPAIDLFKAAGRWMNNPQVARQTEFLAKVKRRESIVLATDDPKLPVQRLFHMLLTVGPGSSNGWKQIFASKTVWGPQQSALLASLQNEITGLGASISKFGIPRDVFLDLVLSSFEFTTEGEEKIGYRVAVQSNYSMPHVFFVTKEDSEYRILGNDSKIELVAQKILDLAESGNLNDARKWLDWVASSNGAGLIAGMKRPAYAYLWSGVTPETRTKGAALNAGAAALGQSAGSSRAIAILQQALPKAANATERNQLNLALAESFAMAEKWKELLDAAYRLEATPLFAHEGYQYELQALVKLARWAEIVKVAGARLTKNQSDLDALRALLAGAVATRNDAKAAEYAEALSDSTFASWSDREMAARAFVGLGKPSAGVLKKMSEDSDLTIPASHHYSLGFLQCAKGDAEDAIRSLLAGLDRDDFSQLDAQPWILQGRILALLGMNEAAKQSYAKRTGARKSPLGTWAEELLNR